MADLNYRLMLADDAGNLHEVMDAQDLLDYVDDPYERGGVIAEVRHAIDHARRADA